jgi:hypothetical protein
MKRGKYKRSEADLRRHVECKHVSYCTTAAPTSLLSLSAVSVFLSATRASVVSEARSSAAVVFLLFFFSFLQHRRLQLPTFVFVCVFYLAMPSSSGVSSPDVPHPQAAMSFARTCESYCVDSRLLYNDIEQMSNKRFRYAQQLVQWSRLLALAAVAAAGVSGLACYYQRAQIHRVWRLRNPRRVHQLSLLTMGSGGFSLCTFLFLISPIGLMRLHDKEVRRTHELDAIAVSALVQEQNFRTLAAWSAQAATSADTSVTKRSDADQDVLPRTAAAEQWVWTEVILDPTQLLSKRSSTQSTQLDHADVDSATVEQQYRRQTGPQKIGGEKGKAEENATGAVRTGMNAAKEKLAAELLLASPPSPATAAGKAQVGSESVDAEASMGADAARLRRVWKRTSDPAELQSILTATVAMWEMLVSAKTEILAKVL